MKNQNDFENYLKTLNSYENSYIKFFNDYYSLKEQDAPNAVYFRNSISDIDILKLNSVLIDEDVTNTSLPDLLLSYIYKKNYKTPNNFVDKSAINLDKKFFGQIMSGKRKPGKEYLLKLAVALELGRDDFGELLKVAGCCLQNNPLDKIVLLCVKEQVFEQDKIDSFCKHFEVENIFWKELSNAK